MGHKCVTYHSHTATWAYRSANACGGVERTADRVRASETRALCSIRAVAVAVGTTAGRARAGGLAAGALLAIWVIAVPALQATNLAASAAKIFLFIACFIQE